MIVPFESAKNREEKKWINTIYSPALIKTFKIVNKGTVRGAGAEGILPPTPPEFEDEIKRITSR